MVEKIYLPELKLDGTIDQLIDWSWRYTDDYSDDALDKISELAKERNLPEEKVRIPQLAKEARQRESAKDDTLPYEIMKHDLLVDGKMGYSETKEYGEVEIMSEADRVILSVTGASFTAVGAFSVEEFLNGDENWLESAIGSVLYYARMRDTEED